MRSRNGSSTRSTRHFSREASSLTGEQLPMGRVLMRADGGGPIGLGHLMRLRAIARALSARSSTSVILGRGVEALPQAVADWSRTSIDDLSSVGDAPKTDADRTVKVARAEGADVVLVDHYALGEDWERRVKRALPDARIVAIDDLPGRRHAADILIDPNLGEDGPIAADVDARLMSGPAYAPLADEYRDDVGSDEHALGRPTILVSLGGGASELVRDLGVVFLDDPRTRSIDLILVVPDSTVREELSAAADEHPSVLVSGAVASLRPLLERADLVVGAGGTSAWERLRLGRPSVVLAVADNQIRTCRALSELGLATWAQADGRPGDLVDAAFSALDDRSLAHRARIDGPLLVDGAGAERIAFAIAPSRELPTFRRAALQDASSLLGMANDPVTRAASRSRAAIRPAEHRAWLEGALEGGQAPFWVAASGGLVVGQVRFDDLGEAWELGYGLDPVARGLGWSGPLVAEGVRCVREHRDLPVVAVVADANPVGHHALQRLGFQRDPAAQRAVALGARVDDGFSAYILEVSRSTA